MENLLKPEKTIGRAINEDAIQERILKSTVPVTAWVTACLLRDGTTSIPIGELYADYENYCRRENCPSLARKTWIAAMKLAGFQTQSGAFVGLLIQ
jgi:hypothetical protein